MKYNQNNLMWDINAQFENLTGNGRKSTIFLKANQELNIFITEYPITWTGFIDNQNIEIIQPTSSSSFSENYKFKTFPDEYFIYKEEIILLINNRLKRALD